MKPRNPIQSGFISYEDYKVKGHSIRKGQSHARREMIEQSGDFVCPECGASFTPAFGVLGTTGNCSGMAMRERFAN